MPSQTRVSTKPSFFEDFQGNPAGPAGLKEEVGITKDQCGTPGSVTSACPWGWLCRTQAAAGSSHGFSEVTMLPSSSQERASDGPAWGRGHPRASQLWPGDRTQPVSPAQEQWKLTPWGGGAGHLPPCHTAVASCSCLRRTPHTGVLAGIVSRFLEGFVP